MKQETDGMPMRVPSVCILFLLYLDISFCLKYLFSAVILLFVFWGYFLQKCSSLYAAYTESLGSDKVL